MKKKTAMNHIAPFGQLILGASIEVRRRGRWLKGQKIDEPLSKKSNRYGQAVNFWYQDAHGEYKYLNLSPDTKVRCRGESLKKPQLANNE